MVLCNPRKQLLLLLASLAGIPLYHCQSQAPDIAQEALGPSSTLEHHHNPALPFCDLHLAKLPGGSGPHTREGLRDALQQLQLQHRIVENLRGMEEHKQLQPSRDEEKAMQKAHGTPLNLQELQQQLHAAQQELERLQVLLDASMQAMRQQGLLHSNTTEIIASSCLLGRLNPRLYPARPQVRALDCKKMTLDLAVSVICSISPGQAHDVAVSVYLPGGQSADKAQYHVP